MNYYCIRLLNENAVECNVCGRYMPNNMEYNVDFVITVLSNMFNVHISNIHHWAESQPECKFEI